MHDSPSWMLIRLALETRSHHAGADADRLVLVDEAPTTERYRSFLTAIYAFESRYEHALVQAPDLEPRIARNCSRMTLLHRDLTALGVADDDLVALPQPHIPAFRSVAEALGWAYVVERNTLLDNLVRRHLWRILPTDIARAGSYLSAHPSAGDHYRELGLEIDDAARRTIPSIIVDAAHAAFACQRLWFAHSRAADARRVAS